MARAHAIRRSTTQNGGGGKRPVLLLLVVVATVSFAAGVAVGRRGTPAVATELPPAPTSPRIAVVREGASGAMGAAAAAANSGGKDLTFYETLTRGAPTALGSGINNATGTPAGPAAVASAPAPPPAVTPVAAEPPVPPSAVSKAPPPAAGKGVAPAPAAGKAPTAATAAKPAPAGHAAYVLQAAAYKAKGEADKLKAKLAAKGYPVFVEAADLGPKGKWQRVYVGPFGDATAAEAARQKLATSDKIAAMVRKR